MIPANSRNIRRKKRVGERSNDTRGALRGGAENHFSISFFNIVGTYFEFELKVFSKMPVSNVTSTLV